MSESDMSDYLCEVCNRTAIGEKARYNAEYDAYVCKKCAERVHDWMQDEGKET